MPNPPQSPNTNTKKKPKPKSPSTTINKNTTTNNNNKTTKNSNSQKTPNAPDLWKQAYKALNQTPQGAKSLQKLQKKLKEAIGQGPELHLRSADGYKHLRALIDARSAELKKDSKAASVCANMLRLKDLVGVATSVAGPYVAIPTAALFMVFSISEIYREERATIYALAETLTHYTILSAKCPERVRITRTDDPDMQKLKQTLLIVCIGLYKDILFSCAELANFFYSDWKRTRLVLRTHDWKTQLESLTRHFDLYVHYRDEMDARPSAVIPSKPQQPTSKRHMGPGPRNPLHWAVSLGVPERVHALLSSQEYPINALTPKSWTVAHLAARNSNTGILRAILTAPGINLSLQESEHGRTALHIACMHNKPGNVKALLERNKHVLGLRDARGRTGWHLAAMKGYVKVLEVLIREKGQSVDEATTKSGWTALHFAAEEGHVDVVRWLLVSGAKADVRSKVVKGKGVTAKQAAEKKGREEVVKLL